MLLQLHRLAYWINAGRLSAVTSMVGYLFAHDTYMYIKQNVNMPFDIGYGVDPQLCRRGSSFTASIINVVDSMASVR